MRNWVEKLAKVSEEKGEQYRNKIRVNDIEWTTWKSYENKGYYISIDCNSMYTTHKLYEDEYDLLYKTEDYILNKAKDQVTEIINNL